MQLPFRGSSRSSSHNFIPCATDAGFILRVCVFFFFFHIPHIPKKFVVIRTPRASDRENRMGARASVKQLSPIRRHCRAMFECSRTVENGSGIVPPLLRSADYPDARDTIYLICIGTHTYAVTASLPLSLSLLLSRFFLRLHKYERVPLPTEMYPRSSPVGAREDEIFRSNAVRGVFRCRDIAQTAASLPAHTSETRRAGMSLLRYLVSRGKFADETRLDESRRQKWGACPRHCARDHRIAAA